MGWKRREGGAGEMTIIEEDMSSRIDLQGSGIGYANIQEQVKMLTY
jgi:hypothetical protein